MNLTYQACSIDELDTLLAIQKNHVLRYEDPTMTDMRIVLQQIEQNLRANITSYTAVYNHNEIVAYYHIFEDYDLFWNLPFFYVYPKYRKKGIGTLVIQKLQEMVDDPIVANVYFRDTLLVDFFEKNDFQMKKVISKSRMTLEWK